MTDALGLAEKVNKFNQQALKHLESQTLNPFSGRFSRSPSPRPRFSKDEYGKPKAGSLTDLRGQKAFIHISREILDLCNLIHDVGSRKKQRGECECDEEEDDGQIIMTFGELFAIYSKISDKVVGLLIAAKKRGFVYFEPEILFQRRDDDVLIALMKPIEEIRSTIDRQLSASPSPASITTPYFNDKEEQPEQPEEVQTSTDPSATNENQTHPSTELPTVKEEQSLRVMDETQSACDPSSRKGSVCSPTTDETPTETSGENQESKSLPNSDPSNDTRTDDSPTTELPSDIIEETPSSTESSSNKDESCSTPVTEYSTSNEEQMLSTPEPSNDKAEPTLLYPPATAPSSDKAEPTLLYPPATAPSSDKAEPTLS